MEKKYVKRTLISAEGAWRMGSTRALLLPCSDTDRGVGGVVVVLPDLSLALNISADKSSEVVTTSLPQMASGSNGKRNKAGRRRSSGFMDRLFSDDQAQTVNPAIRVAHSSPHVGKSAIVWAEGNSDLCCFDLQQQKISVFSLESTSFISSVSFLRRCADGSEEYLLTLLDQPETKILKLEFGSPGESFPSPRIAAVGAFKHEDTESAMSPTTVKSDFIAGCNDTLTDASNFGGDALNYAKRIVFNRSSLLTWARDRGTPEAAPKVLLSVASRKSTYSILADDRKKGMIQSNCLCSF